MLVDEENIMLEAGIKMSLQAKLTDDRVVMAVNVGIDTIHPLEYLPDHARKRLWEWNALELVSKSQVRQRFTRTYATREDGLIIDIALNPAHQVFDVGWCWHLGWSLVILGILPEILKPVVNH